MLRTMWPLNWIGWPQPWSKPASDLDRFGALCGLADLARSLRAMLHLKSALRETTHEAIRPHRTQAANAGELFGLSKSEIAMLNETPMRGIEMPPTDPLIYRFYELVMVNGPAWKALIEEEYGDGIMSAIDFDMVMERLPNPKGDRV